jgi:hypothetical protein
MKRLLAAAILALAIPAPELAHAQASPDDASFLAQRCRGRVDREAMRGAAVIAEAAATYRSIVDMALRNRPAGVRIGIAESHALLPRLQPVVDDRTYGAVEARVTDMDNAFAKEDLNGAALAATEAFRGVVTAIDPTVRRMPLDVALLHYTAMKLAVLSSASEIDWPAIQATAKESERSWIGIRRYIRDANLRVLLAEINSGLREAANRNDAAGVRFAASLQTQSIAVLQDFFERLTQAMARARR